jgi:hypothetical protein
MSSRACRRPRGGGGRGGRVLTAALVGGPSPGVIQLRGRGNIGKYTLARTRPEKPVRTPGGSGRLGCSRLSRRPPIAPGSPRPTRGDLGSRVSYAHVRRKTSRPRAHPPSAASRRRSLRFAQWRRHVRQQDASRDCQEWCASPDVPHWTKSAGTIPPRMLCLFGAKL